MIKRIRQAFFCAVIFFIASVYAGAQNSSLAASNRRVATRYLGRAENALTVGNWESAIFQAEMGRAYDDGISDLWYVTAAAEYARGSARAVVIPLVEKALLGGGEWVDYNRDGARVLYADLLCDTGNYERAVEVLDAMPFIYSADAEFIRAKSFYRTGTPESIARAREKINSARRIYQSDKRFAHLFFRHEYALAKSGAVYNQNDLVKRVAKSFINYMPSYDNPDAELEIFAAIFAEGEDHIRLLQAFTAHNQRHVLYAAEAVKTGLMNELDAIDYFFSFNYDSIDFYYLLDFVSAIKDDDALKHLAAVLNAFEGTMVVDTNNDLVPNMAVEYVRGRPQEIRWDGQSDGILEWTVNCDFGVPVSAVIGNGILKIEYGTYPAIISASLVANEFGGTYKYADESFYWTPCEISIHEKFASLEGCTFFVPFPVNNSGYDAVPNTEFMVRNASYYESPSTERPNAVVAFALVDSFPVMSDYYVNGVRYAHAVFENGLPVMRSVDNDGDGIFETTQYFGFDPKNDMNQPESERASLKQELFNIPEMPAGIYLRLVQTDTNGDAIPDFVEEYLSDGGRISSWYTAGNDVWSMQFYRHPARAGRNVIEEARFYKIPGYVLVSVYYVNGMPVRVVSGDITYDVYAGSDYDFYWIGKKSTEEVEKNIRKHVNQNASQGVSLMYESVIDFDGNGVSVVESEKNIPVSNIALRFFVVRIGDIIFAEQIN